MNEPTTALIAAAERLAARQPSRHRPSPSSVENCTRANWFSETGVAPTEIPDAESYISAESGRVSEAILIEIVREAGFHIDDLTDEARELGGVQLGPLFLRGGQFDQQAQGSEGWFLVEFKRKGAFPFLKITEQGVREADPGIYSQCQILMAATQLKRCLLVVANWDRGGLTTAQRRAPTRVPGIYAEWIDFSAPAAAVASKRAKMQLHYIENETKAARVPRDYDPMGSDWHCIWCSWRTACLAAEGVKHKPGRVGEK